MDGQNGRLFVGCGFSGHGFKLAPIVGNLLAELVVHGHSHSYPNAAKIFSLQRLVSKHEKQETLSDAKL